MPVEQQLSLYDMSDPRQIAMDIHKFWKRHNDLRQDILESWSEVRRYVYATSTLYSADATTPWQNKTTRNKLAWIYDKLLTHYVQNLMPNQDFFLWKADQGAEVPQELGPQISYYMKAKVRHKHVGFRKVMLQCLSDYIMFGNAMAMPEYKQVFHRNQETGEENLVFSGAVPVRLPPYDFVFDPSINDFNQANVCTRTVIPKDEFLKGAEGKRYDPVIMESILNDEFMTTDVQDWIKQNHLAQDGVQFLNQLNEGKIEFMEFYGSVFDSKAKQWFNDMHVVTVNRSFVLLFEPIDTYQGIKPMVFSSFRKRPDNLWGQGPLENIVGLQYRIDHIENLKADSVDIMGWPVIVFKGEGMEEQLVWRPGAQWDLPPNSDVEIIYPNPQLLQYNEEILTYERAMEEYAGVPRETAGFRTPGEKTRFEVEALLDNAAKPMGEKLKEFEEEFLEPLLNAMLEMNLKYATSMDIQRLFPERALLDSQAALKAMRLAAGQGSIYALGAKNYEIRNQRIANMKELLELGATIQSPHIAQFQALKLIERDLGAEEDGIISFGAALEEQAGLAQKQQTLEQQQNAIQGPQAAGPAA